MLALLIEQTLRGNESGSVAGLLDLHPARRAKVAAYIVSRARFPPWCADGVERFCARAAACGRQKQCDDETVTVQWTADGSVPPGREAAGGDSRVHLSLIRYLHLGCPSGSLTGSQVSLRKSRRT